MYAAVHRCLYTMPTRLLNSVLHSCATALDMALYMAMLHHTPEALRVLPHEVPSQEAAVGPANDRSTILVSKACRKHM